jgi:predicted PurR-regulated permease PerM
MEPNISNQVNKIIRWVIAAVTIFAVLYVLWYFINLVAYILISVVLSLIGKPLVSFISGIRVGKKHIPDWIGAMITIAGMWITLGGALFLLVPFIGSQAKKFSQVDRQAILQSLQQPIDEVVMWLEKYEIRFENNQTLEQYINSQVVEAFNLSNFSNIFGTVFPFLEELIIGIFSISFITFFFLRDNTLFYKSVLTITPEKYEDQVKEIIRDTRELLTRYFIGIAIQLMLVMICITIGCLILGLNFQLSITIGFAAGLFNIIPYVGPLLSAAFGIMLVFAENINQDFYVETLPLIYKLIAVYSITKVLDDFVFQPFIFSNRVKAHPLELFLVILVAGNLAGLIGMILAIPFYTFMRIIAKQFFSNFKVVQKLTRDI